MSAPSPPAADEPARARLMGQRLERLRDLMRASGGETLLLDKRRDIGWLTVGAQHHVVLSTETAAVPLLVTQDACLALAPINEAARIAQEELRGLSVEMITLPWHDPDAAREEAERRANGRLLRIEDLGEEMTVLRSRLAPMEHDRLRWLGAVCSEQMSEALANVERGTTEDEVAAAVISGLQRAGIRTPVLLVAADERIESYRHPLPQGQPIRRRVMLVAVGERWGLHVAATRIRELEPPPSQLQARTEACNRVLGEMRAASQPGTTLGDVVAAAAAAYEREGFPEEWKLHHQGGTIGYAGRERVATPGDRTPLDAGMAVAWNPSITGTKAEATDLIGTSGLESIAS